MTLLRYLFRNAGRDLAVLASLGMVSGIASAFLIALVNAALHGGTHRRAALLAGFLAVVLVKMAASLGTSLMLVRLAQNAVLGICKDLARGILATPYRRLEMIGPARLHASLTDDVTTLSGAIQALPSLIVNITLLAGCLAYLAWISPVAAGAMALLVAVGALCYKKLSVRAYAALERARQGKDALFRDFRTLTEGLKELKLHRERREIFFNDELGATMEYLRGQNVAAARSYTIADVWTQGLFYFLICSMLFGLPWFGEITLESLSAFILTALYAMAPVWGIIGAVPVFTRGQTALERMQQLELSLAPAAAAAKEVEVRRVPPRIELEEVSFRYDDSEGSFALGPLSLTLEPGEMVFVIGGNGSGKSTFVKLLTGLYSAAGGTIRLDGKPLSASSEESYRELFSVVYSDFHLFDRVYEPMRPETEERARQYLLLLQLSHKVRLEGQHFSSTSLSQGQRRRLALLAAYLEDRPVYVLDEWAADQDPGFRQIFYTQLLPELKRRGKTIVVVTHDDRYFQYGDKIVKLDYGRVSDLEPAALVARP